MIRLCGFRISNYHNKVRIALLEKGVPFEEDASVHAARRSPSTWRRARWARCPTWTWTGSCCASRA